MNNESMNQRNVINDFQGDKEVDIFDRSEEQRSYSTLEDDQLIELIDIERSVKHKENWSLLLRDRLLNPEIKERFISNKKKLSGQSKYEIGQVSFDYISKVYDENIESAFKLTHIEPAASYGKVPEVGAAGESGSGYPGVVFSDAVLVSQDGKKVEAYNSKQKMIAEAHEKLHGALDYYLPREVILIEDSFNISKLVNGSVGNYKRYEIVFELVARMSQIKNYFGFRGSEKFTLDHLRFAKEHYVSDTGFDNNMTDFFDAITPEKENKFVELMNTIAC